MPTDEEHDQRGPIPRDNLAQRLLDEHRERIRRENWRDNGARPINPPDHDPDAYHPFNPPHPRY